MEDFYRNAEEFYKQNSSSVHFAVLLLVSASVGYLLPEHIQRESQFAAVTVPVVENRPVLPEVVYAETRPGVNFGPWFTIAHWGKCTHLMQQGSVFELQNAEGQVMLSECTSHVPQKPFGWNSDPVRFRLVKEPIPRHSPPTPEPIGSEQI
jgi:hypothetical protein